jgi:hypothetical protein
VINGLGLFAALGSPDSSVPQPAPAEDPAVFAAALVAALGLRAAVQEAPVATSPAPETPEPGAEQGDSDQLEGEGETTAKVPSEAASAEGKGAQPVVARVTPDPEMVKETALGAVLRGKPPAGTGTVVDVVSDEAAVPVTGDAKPGATSPAPLAAAGTVTPSPTESRTTETGTAPSASSEVAQPSITAAAGQRPEPVPAPKVVAPQGEVVQEKATTAPSEPDETGDRGRGVRRPGERRGARATSQADVIELAGADRSAAVPVPAAVAATTVAQPVVAEAPANADGGDRDRADPRVVDTGRPSTSVPHPADAKLSQAVADAARQVAESTPAPPQSVEERTARAMAENTRVERQLAELLGDTDVTEFKLQLGRRPVTPQPATTVKPDQHDVRGTFAREAVAAADVQRAPSAPVTIAPATARSEVVRMVANATRAMAPNVAATEGTPAVAKAPAPSMAPSLPVVRQELPADSARAQTGESDERDRKPARDASASDAASPSSPLVANNATANPARPGRGESAEPREARNLPPHGSTDQKAAGSADRVTLQVADDEGRQTRIRVSVTGNQIRAVITPPDSASARQLEQRMDQLHETLVRQGFVDPKLVVRAAPEMVSDAAVMAGAGTQDGRSTVPAGKDQPAGEQRQGRGQREQDRGDGHRHPQGHSRERDPRDRRR